MKSVYARIASFAVLLSPTGAIPTWPSSIDELEDVMFLNTGYRSRGLSAHITPCSYSEFGAGRQTAAEWLRIGFHDMATTNIYQGLHGGLDGSIAFELSDGENIGLGFNTSLITYSGFFNSRLPISDMIALGVYASVRGCGGPIVPMRGGRVDATVANQMGVPQPQNGRGTFENQFARMGFNITAMIQMTACGHTLGGVHAGDFPNIVTPGTAPNDFQLFDTTTAFDNLIAVQYINGPNSDPLAVGPSVASTRNSDVAVFGADNNATLRAMTNAATFNTMCSAILQEMIETVDPAIVTLSDIIQPYEVKPEGLQLTLLGGGTQIQFTGDIRVRTTNSAVSSVTLTYKDRTEAGSYTITTTQSGTANGFDDSFSFYGFSANLPVATSISSFTVAVTYTTGQTITYSNNGSGFLVQDIVMVQTSQSCQSNGNLTVVVAVRNGSSAPSLTIEQKVARPSGTPVPSLVSSTLSMVAGSSFGIYTFYSASSQLKSMTGAKYGVSSGSSADTFKDVSALGVTCGGFAALAPSSTSSVASTTSSSSSAASSTLGIRPTIGAYTYQGCYTEGAGVRALTAASFYNYTGMTLEQCIVDCAGYVFAGIEYGGECYCGDTLNGGSSLADAEDCSFTCPGNPYEYCGAGNRLDMYKLTSASTISSSVVSKSSATASLSSSPTSKSSSISSSQVSTVTSRSSSLTSVSATSTPTLAIKTIVGAYTFQGCYTEGSGIRALTGASFFNYTAMTLEMCATNCAGFAYAGIEYGGECYCGNSLNGGSAQAANQADCNFVCPGNQYEFCGAGDRIEMYLLTSKASGRIGSSSSESSITFTTSTKPTTVGFVTSSIIKATSSGSMTSKSSTSSKFSSTSTTSTKSSSTFVTTSKTSSSAMTTQTAPTIVSQIGNYTYLACRTEGDNIRALTGAVLYNYTSMTLEMCVSYCSGYKYLGVEYYGECYCGNSFNTGSIIAPDSDCSFICPGNSSEYCGAGNRLSSYVQQE